MGVIVEISSSHSALIMVVFPALSSPNITSLVSRSVFFGFFRCPNNPCHHHSLTIASSLFIFNYNSCSSVSLKSPAPGSLSNNQSESPRLKQNQSNPSLLNIDHLSNLKHLNTIRSWSAIEWANQRSLLFVKSETNSSRFKKEELLPILRNIKTLTNSLNPLSFSKIK